MNQVFLPRRQSAVRRASKNHEGVAVPRRRASANGVGTREGTPSRGGEAALGLALAVAAVALVSGCEEGAHREIQDEINILTRRNDALVPPATDRLGGFGRLAIPQIETALHTAAPTGRLHLIEALERIGDDEAIPVLRHCAVYDIRSEVRRTCADLLAAWADGPPDGQAATRRRAERAKAARVEIARKQAAGEAPLVFEGGTPGVPTVGAPDPVGSDLEKRP